MHYRIASIILNSNQTANNAISEIFVAQPDANKEALAGRLFALIEINFNKTQALKIINFLINNINHNYYQNEKIILRERISSLKVEHIFETSLAKTNNDLAEFLDREKIKINPTDFNITIGVIHENNLHFSSAGKNKALLIYKHKSQIKKQRIKKSSDMPDSETKYKVADISGGQTTSAKTAKGALNKIFSNVISGQMPIHGYFLFTNETLPEYLSNKQLIAIITKLPPASAAEQIKSTLSKVNAYVSFLGIIIKNTTGLKPIILSPENTLAREEQNVSVQNSINGLNYTEATTEEVLAPYGLINFKKWLKVPANFGAKAMAKIRPGQINRQTSKEKMFLMKDKMFFKKKQAWLSFKKILTGLKLIGLYLVKLLAYIFRLLTNRDQQRKFFSTIKQLWVNTVKRVKNSWFWFKSLNKRNKILLTIATACLLLFIISSTITSFSNKRQEVIVAINELRATIEQKQNQIDANLLYSNEAGAKKILDELKIMFEELPRDSENNIEYYNKIMAKNEQQSARIRHVTKIESPTEIANLTNLNSQAKADNIILILGEEKIYTGDSKQQTIYSIDLGNNLATAITDLNQPIKKLTFPMVDKNNLYYLNEDSLITLNVAIEEISSTAIALPTSFQNIAAGTSFNNRLYLLDSSNNEIYRFTKTANGFSTRNNWLVETADLSKAVDISIDGHVYILENNGQVLKYLKGQEQDFSLEPIEPDFSSPTKLIVSSDLEYIYILEPANKRLAIFNKAGEFIMQYQSDSFNNLKDFAVDETNKIIYFLNANSVYAIDGTHFEED